MKEKSWTRHSNFKWCVDNDFQVYVCPDGFLEEKMRVTKEFRVCIRRGGITTCGKDDLEVNATIYESKEVPSTKVYKTQAEAEAALPEIYERLRKTYG